jgi:hypothetical protein
LHYSDQLADKAIGARAFVTARADRESNYSSTACSSGVPCQFRNVEEVLSAVASTRREGPREYRNFLPTVPSIGSRQLPCGDRSP